MWLRSLFLYLIASEQGSNNQETSGFQAALENPCTESLILDEYILLDLVGYPNDMTETSFTLIQDSILEAYSELGPSCRVLEGVTIVPDAIDNQIKNDGTDPQDFFYIARAQGSCTGCKESFLFDYSDTSNRRSLKGESGNSKSTENGLRRGLEEESDCNCEGPTKTAFLEQVQNIYKDKVLDASAENTISEFRGVTEVSFQEDCATTASSALKFSTMIFLSFETPTGNPLTDDEKEKLKDLFLDTYNVPNANVCDPQLRKVTAAFSTTALPDVKDIDLEYLPLDPHAEDPHDHMILYVTGKCYDCDSETNMFDPVQEESAVGGSSRRRLDFVRTLNEEEKDWICMCPLDAPLRSSTIDEFSELFSTVIESLSFDVALKEILELDPQKCSEDTSEFSEVVIVELEVCEDQDITADIEALETGFLETYNDLIVDYCDPYDRNLLSVSFVRQGKLTEEGNLPIEMRVTGKCRNCNPDEISIYDASDGATRRLTSSRHFNQRRKLEKVACYCKTDPIAYRGPSEIEVLDVYRDIVSSSLGDSLSCVDTVEECIPEREFGTSLLLVFDNSAVKVDPIAGEIGTTVLTTLNGVYGANDDTVCNPYFRKFQYIDAEIGVTVNYLDKGESNSLSNRRQLQVPASNPTNSPSWSPTGLPSVSLNPTITARPTTKPSAMPSSMPTIGQGGFLNVLLFITGFCRGCRNNMFALNQVVGRRNLETFERMLEQEVATSSCFCPLDAVAFDEDEITVDGLSTLISIDLDGLDLQLVQTTEVNVAECDSASKTYVAFPTEFVSYIYVKVDLAQNKTVTLSELSQIGDWFLDEYDSANPIECDMPGYKLKSVKPYSSNPFSYIREDEDSIIYLPYEVTVFCTDCVNETMIFNNQAADKSIVIEALEGYFSSGISLVDVEEVKIFSCGNVLTYFEKRVIVDLTTSCEDLPDDINDSVFDTIAAAYVSTYESMNGEYCNAEMTTVIDARVVEVGAVRSGNILPVVLSLQMQCIGCDTDATGAYYVPLELSSSERRTLALRDTYPSPRSRRLEDTDGTCECKTETLADRSPDEAEFIYRYQDALSNLTLGCIDTAEKCLYPADFETSVVVAFEAISGSDFNEEIAAILAETFKETLNNLITVNYNETCNRFFQLVQDVVADIDFIYNNENQNSTLADDVERKLVQRISQERVLEVVFPTASPSKSLEPSSSQSPSSPTVSQSPSFSQSPSTNPTMSKSPSSLPSSMPTIDGSGFVFVLLYITGKCNGCPNNLFGSNQVVGRRTLDDFRSLEQTSDDNLLSNCYCPPGQEVVEGILSSEEVVETFQEKLDEINVPVVASGVTEVLVTDCPAEISNFDTEMTFSFYSYGWAASSSTVLSDFGNFFSTEYNALVDKNCDPLYRRNIQLSNGILVNPPSGNLEECTLVTAKYTVEGECRGCFNGTALFEEENGASRRRLELEECVCEGTPNRPPTVSEVAALVQNYLCSLGDVFDSESPSALPTTSGAPSLSPSCSAVPDGIETNVIVSFFLESTEVLTQEERDELASAWQSTFNTEMINTLDACDPNYAQLTTVTPVTQSQLPTNRRDRRLETSLNIVDLESTCVCNPDNENCSIVCSEFAQTNCESFFTSLVAYGYVAFSINGGGCLYEPRESCLDYEHLIVLDTEVDEIEIKKKIDDYMVELPQYFQDNFDINDDKDVIFVDIECAEPPCRAFMSSINKDDEFWEFQYDLFTSPGDFPVFRLCEQFNYLESSRSFYGEACVTLNKAHSTLIVRKVGDEDAEAFKIRVEQGDTCSCFTGYEESYEEPVMLEVKDDWDSDNVLDDQVPIPPYFNFTTEEVGNFTQNEAVPLEIDCEEDACQVQVTFIDHFRDWCVPNYVGYEPQWSVFSVYEGGSDQECPEIESSLELVTRHRTVCLTVYEGKSILFLQAEDISFRGGGGGLRFRKLEERKGVDSSHLKRALEEEEELIFDLGAEIEIVKDECENCFTTDYYLHYMDTGDVNVLGGSRHEISFPDAESPNPLDSGNNTFSLEIYCEKPPCAAKFRRFGGGCGGVLFRIFEHDSPFSPCNDYKLVDEDLEVFCSFSDFICFGLDNKYNTILAHTIWSEGDLNLQVEVLTEDEISSACEDNKDGPGFPIVFPPGEGPGETVGEP